MKHPFRNSRPYDSALIEGRYLRETKVRTRSLALVETNMLGFLQSVKNKVEYGQETGRDFGHIWDLVSKYRLAITINAYLEEFYSFGRELPDDEIATSILGKAIREKDPLLLREGVVALANLILSGGTQWA